PSGIRDDLRATARTILHAIGGDPTRGTADVPGPYAAVLRAVATDGVTPHGDRDAWALRERLGAVGRAAFGAPGFFPILPRR
ncbi:MAG: hypothetical protein Q8P18_26235, partial [Pseudomonadota bacterium]|nr:hypothetical protein [Pseudomonadota bacterium]